MAVLFIECNIGLNLTDLCLSVNLEHIFTYWVIVPNPKRSYGHAVQGRSQNLKQVPQNFIKFFDADDVTLTF